MEFAIFWLIFAIICGIFAAQRGRSGFGYFLLSMIISPLLCFLLIAVLGPKHPAQEIIRPTSETHVKCPDCAEFVLKEAKKCKHCGANLIPIA